MMLLSYTIVDFIYSMMGLLIYKYEPLRQEVSVKSVILRWPLGPVGLLFYIFFLIMPILFYVSIWIEIYLLHNERLVDICYFGRPSLSLLTASDCSWWIPEYICPNILLGAHKQYSCGIAEVENLWIRVNWMLCTVVKRYGGFFLTPTEVFSQHHIVCYSF